MATSTKKSTVAAKTVAAKTVAAKTTAAKKAVKSAKSPKSNVVKIGDKALNTVYKVKKAYPNGVRAEFTSAIPKSGAPLSTIAKKAGVAIAKARGYAYWLASNGYLTRVAA